MACYAPNPAYRRADGTIVFVERGDIHSTMLVPCGRCVGCRLDYAHAWEVRIMHEASMWPESCFVTLTYAPEFVSTDGSLVYSDFQLFMRRLRKLFRGRKIRFFCAGEYGDDLGRPHFHVALFNIHFREDMYYWRRTEQGFRVFRSPTLEQLWKHGHSEIGNLTAQSANYIARYVTKKITGDLADSHYQCIDTSTGEVTWKVPEFSRMSLKPGIGGDWFKKFHSDVFPHDRVIAGGVRKKVPRYYDKLYKKMNPDELEVVKMERGVRARSRFEDNTPERLSVREDVEQARLRYFKRRLE